MNDDTIQLIIKTQDQATQQLKEVQSQISGLGGSAQKAGPSFMSMASAVAVGQMAFNGIKKVVDESIGFFKSCTQEVTDLGGEVRILKAQTGMTSEQVTGFISILERFGISGSQASMSLKTFSKQIVATTNDNRKSATAFDQLGIKVKDVHGKLIPTNDLIMKVADKFQSMPDGAIKTAEATALFGRAAANLIPVLDKGSSGLKELEDEAAKMGLVLTDKNIVAIQQYKKANADMQEAMTGLKLQIGTALMPVFADMATKISTWATSAEGQKAIHAITAEITLLSQEMSKWVSTVAIPWIQQHWPEIKRVVKEFWDVFVGLIKFIVDNKQVFEALAVLFLGIKTALVAQGVIQAVKGLGGALGGLPGIVAIGVAIDVGLLMKVRDTAKGLNDQLERMSSKDKSDWWKSLSTFEKVTTEIGTVLTTGHTVKHADGGIIYAADGYGGPSGTDTVPAWLTPREMVINEKQQKRLFDIANGKGGGGGININFYGPVSTANGTKDIENLADRIGYMLQNSQAGI